ncbi:MAG TPA: hypothetical protein VFI13_04645, partial [Gemmatimonadales bacterium]|nr:hypothetical protein [Gemmatimonadales bacterium]
MAEEEGGIVDPLEARAGDVLDGRFEVLRRLGSGATAVALLVADDQAGGAQRVLKVALNDDRAAQLTAEADVLARLAHPAIVRLISDPLTIGGRRALLLARAGERTLSERIATDGPPGLELLERWGNDLLAAVAHLEECGLAHRDIKPDNIGVAEQGKNKELHLVVFDLSLARVPADELGVGTTGYVDPFLRQPGRGRWDTHAERFAAAVTLHQLATGELPRWGAEGVDPLMTDAEVTIDPARFDPALAGRFVDFFRTAFARDVTSRFGSIEDMATAWRRCFEPAAVPVPGPEPAPPRLDDATLTTPLTDLGLSNRATSALERAGLLTVGDLLT